MPLFGSGAALCCRPQGHKGKGGGRVYWPGAGSLGIEAGKCEQGVRPQCVGSGSPAVLSGNSAVVPQRHAEAGLFHA